MGPFTFRKQSVRDEISELIENSINRKDSFDNHESTLLRNILNLKDLTAESLMVPRADIVSIDLNDDLDSVMAHICDANHSRLPVHNGSMDVIQGMIHIKDLMPHLLSGSKPDLLQLMRPVLFVSPSIWVMDLLHEMRLKRRHLALVVDEFGGVDGLITIEDLVEEIVGEIEDEHDALEVPRFELIDDDSAIADARLELEDLEKLVGFLVDGDDREEIDTVAGLVFSLAGRVPVRGEVIRHPSGLEFEVLEGDPRRITLIKIEGIQSVKTSQGAKP
ncbi:hemolysin family protein [Alphaproteobacteria bacterium]|nr:hemolysin family protein [Alphaproteobacteria bacterium]